MSLLFCLITVYNLKHNHERLQSNVSPRRTGTPVSEAVLSPLRHTSALLNNSRGLERSEKPAPIEFLVTRSHEQAVDDWQVNTAAEKVREQQ